MFEIYWKSVLNINVKNVYFSTMIMLSTIIIYEERYLTMYETCTIIL